MNKYLKIILVLVLIGTFSFYPLHMARAVEGWLIVTKEYVLDLVGRLIARTLLSVMSNSVIGVIGEAGRDGGPAFVQDWGDFLKNAQYRGEDILRAKVADATLGANATTCPYLRSPLNTVFGVRDVLPGFDSSKYRLDSLQYYKLRNRCTLPANFDVNQFRNDFIGGGGWSTWNQLIKPQNNFFGVYADTLDELSKQRGFEQGIDLSEAESGSGYTSKRTGCSGNSPLLRSCTILGKVITPADIFGKSGAATIDNEFGWLVSSDELQEALVNLAGIVINKLSKSLIENVVPTGVIGEENGPPGSEESPAGNNAAIEQARQNCVNQCVESQNCSSGDPIADQSCTDAARISCENTCQ